MCARPVAERCWAMRCGAPLWPWRTMNMSAFIATRLSTVSSSVSALVVEDTAMFRLITAAERRLAAISKVVRVRVLFSKKRLNTVLPRSRGTFFTSRSATDTNGTAVSSMRLTMSAGSSSSVSRCCSRPAALSCGLRTGCAPCLLDRKLETAIEVSLQHDRQVAGDRKPRADVGCLDRQLATAAVDEHRQLDCLRPPVVEQFVDGGAHRATGVEDVVDQDDAAAGDFERKRGRLEFRAQPLLRVVVAVERHVDVADRVLAVEHTGQAFGEPCAAGVDADQTGIVGDRPAHLVGEDRERGLGVRQDGAGQ